MKTLSVFHFVFVGAITAALGQAPEALTLTKPAPTNPTNTLSFSLPSNRLTDLHQSKGQKINFKVPLTVVNGDSIKTERIRIRGTSSSLFRRKSLNIKLAKKASFYSRSDTFSLKKFYAVSMNMDRNYIRNRISFEVLRRMNLNIVSSVYANLFINKSSEGLYMIFYPPEDFAIDERGAALVIRRVRNASIDDMSFEGISGDEAKLLRKKFQSIYTEIMRKHKGEDLYNKLGEVLDLNGYFSWLAFNHLFQNGDYSDELYLMWNRTKNQFELIPWDFDDLLHSQPHEGFETRDAVLRDKLIFSSEDALDVKIAKDDFLYMKYLQVYKELLEMLTPSVLSEVLNIVYQDVYPYYVQPDVISQSQYDRTGLTDIHQLEADIQRINRFIGDRVVVNRDKIDTWLKEYEGAGK